ncbi:MULTISPECIES: hypothetical protein [Chitinophagaceae]
MKIYHRNKYCHIALIGILLSCKHRNSFYQGRVLDDDSLPIKNIWVKEEMGNDSVQTNLNGYFKLPRHPSAINPLVFSGDNYESITIPSVYTHAGESLDYYFVMDDTTVVILQKKNVPVTDSNHTSSGTNNTSIHKDTFQYIGTGENEDNTYLQFLDKRLDTTNIVFVDEIELDSFQNKMVEIEWYYKKVVSGGDASIDYNQIFAKQYRILKVPLLKK